LGLPGCEYAIRQNFFVQLFGTSCTYTQKNTYGQTLT